MPSIVPLRKGGAGNRKQLFVSEYLIDLNAEQAAIRAGYSPKSAPTCGPRLLQDPVVAAEVQARIEARSKRVDMTADKVLRDLIDILNVSPLDILSTSEDGTLHVDFNRLPQHQRHLVEDIRIRPNGDISCKFPSKLKALELVIPPQSSSSRKWNFLVS